MAKYNSFTMHNRLLDLMEEQRQSTAFLHRCILGTAGLGGVWGKVDPDESIQAILTALATGITAVDAAPAYGDAELFVGMALKQWKGPLPRVSTKVGRLKSYNAEECYYDYSTEGLRRSLERSLETLGISVIDILFLHEPSAIPPDESERIVENLLEFKRKGYAKRLGLGGNAPRWFKKYITPEIFEVVMEYNRLSAVCMDAKDSSLPDCESKGIIFYAASPLHMGLLGRSFESFVSNPPAWLGKEEIERAQKVQKIAGKYHISLSSLAHRFLLTLPGDFNIVVGAADTDQLQKTIGDFQAGPLAGDIYKEILEANNL